MVPYHRGHDDRDRFLLSVSRLHARNRSRNYIATVPGAGDFRALFQATRRRVALDLHLKRRDLSVFNLFVLIVQSFEKIPALHALAPTQTESPFKLTQLVVLTLSALLCTIAVIRFRPEPARVT